MLAGAERKTFAGVLPGVLFIGRHIRTMHETEVVIDSVIQAIDSVLELESYPKCTPIIILGGKGFIGRRVVKRLKGREVFSVDKSSDKGRKVSRDWPTQLKGSPTLLVNISRKFVLEHYLPEIWPELVLLNEVYPEPSKTELEHFQSQGGGIYHLAGVVGKAFPAFPKAYSGSIPCSAAHGHKNLQVNVKKLG